MNAHDLHRQIKAAEVLRAGLDKITDDGDAIRDTIEGETTLHEAVRAVLLSIEDDLVMVNGLTDRIAELADRKKRFAERVESKRALIEQAMQIGEIEKIELDIGTAFLRPTAQTVEIAQEADVPSGFWEPQPPKLNKSAILAALRAGTEVPGAHLTNGGQGLTIRRR